jgi:ferritin
MAAIDSITLEKLEIQIAREFENSLMYAQLASTAGFLRFQGFAKFLKAQAAGEIEHANKIIDYCVSRNCTRPLTFTKLVEETSQVPANLVSIFEAVVSREINTTIQISSSYRAVLSTGDFMTAEFLHWFLREQVEEEEASADALAKIKSAGSDYAALLILDSRY